MGDGKEYGTIASHARLPWYASRNEDDFCTGESLFQAIGIGLVAGDDALGVDVANISGDTCPQDQLWSLNHSFGS